MSRPALVVCCKVSNFRTPSVRIVTLKSKRFGTEVLKAGEGEVLVL